MILIFGGAYQGKLDYALSRFGASESEVYRCCDENAGQPGARKIIYELDKWILALVKKGADTDGGVKRFIKENRDAVVICNDISSGVVPMDVEMRKWREVTGRALSEIARESDEVIRLFCGLPTRLK